MMKQEMAKKRRLKPAGRWLDINGVRRLLKRAVKNDTYGWAKTNNISQPYVNQVLNGRRLPGKKITKALGLEKALLWRTPHGYYGAPHD